MTRRHVSGVGGGGGGGGGGGAGDGDDAARASEDIVQILKAEPAATLTISLVSTARPCIWIGGQGQLEYCTLPPSVSTNPKRLVLLLAGGSSAAFSGPPPAASRPVGVRQLLRADHSGPGCGPLHHGAGGRHVYMTAVCRPPSQSTSSPLATAGSRTRCQSLGDPGPQRVDRADGVCSLNPAPHASMRDVIKLADRAGRVLVSYTTAADGVALPAVSAVFKLEI